MFQFSQRRSEELDELSIMVVEPLPSPFVYVQALGDFGVMNSDGGWNDSRETLFVELLLDCYRDVYMDSKRALGFAIDGVSATSSGDGWRLANDTGQTRLLRVVFNDAVVPELRLEDEVNDREP